MYDFKYYDNMDAHPASGTRKADFDARLSTKPHLDGFFNGQKDYEQVTGVTRGKIYHIHEVELIGDAVDVKFLDDNGVEKRLGIFFFEDPEKSEKSEDKPAC